MLPIILLLPMTPITLHLDHDLPILLQMCHHHNLTGTGTEEILLLQVVTGIVMILIAIEIIMKVAHDLVMIVVTSRVARSVVPEKGITVSRISCVERMKTESL